MSGIHNARSATLLLAASNQLCQRMTVLFGPSSVGCPTDEMHQLAQQEEVPSQRANHQERFND
jgi:hypothetical protein